MKDQNIKLPPLPRLQVPRIDADIDLMDIRRLVKWAEDIANTHARAAIEADRQARGEPVKVPRERDLLEALKNLDPLVRALMNRLGSGEACSGLDGDQSASNSTTQVLLRAIDRFEGRIRSGAEPVKVPSDDEGEL